MVRERRKPGPSSLFSQRTTHCLPGPPWSSSTIFVLLSPPTCSIVTTARLVSPAQPPPVAAFSYPSDNEMFYFHFFLQTSFKLSPPINDLFFCVRRNVLVIRAGVFQAPDSSLLRWFSHWPEVIFLFPSLPIFQPHHGFAVLSITIFENPFFYRCEFS